MVNRNTSSTRNKQMDNSSNKWKNKEEFPLFILINRIVFSEPKIVMTDVLYE